MKSIVLAVVAVLCVFGCSSSNDSVLVKRGEVDNIHVGDSISGVKRRYGDLVTDSTIVREGNALPAAIVLIVPNHEVVLEIDDHDEIWAIRIADEIFRTERGMGVGSTFRDIQASYPNSILSFGREDGGFLSLFIPELNGFFNFEFDSDLLDRLVLGQAGENDLADLRANLLLLHNR